MKKVVYIAHPISGDVDDNMIKVAKIYKELTDANEVIPFAPYLATLMALDDSNPYHRKRGMEHNMELLRKGFIDEIWLCGDKLSNGMVMEVEEAIKNNIEVKCFDWHLIGDVDDLLERLRKEVKNAV